MHAGKQLACVWSSACSAFRESASVSWLCHSTCKNGESVVCSKCFCVVGSWCVEQQTPTALCDIKDVFAEKPGLMELRSHWAEAPSSSRLSGDVDVNPLAQALTEKQHLIERQTPDSCYLVFTVETGTESSPRQAHVRIHTRFISAWQWCRSPECCFIHLAN